MTHTPRRCLTLLALYSSLIFFSAPGWSQFEPPGQSAARSSSDSIGNATLMINGQRQAGAEVNARLSLKLNQSIEPGDQLIIGQHWTELVRLQNDQPDELAYITADESQNFQPTFVPLDGPFGGLESLAQTVAFNVSESAVPAGETISFAIKSLVLPETATSYYQLRVYLQLKTAVSRLDSVGSTLTIPGGEEALNSVTKAVGTRAASPGAEGFGESAFSFVETRPLQIQPAAFSRLSVSAQSLVSPGEAVSVRFEMQDQFGNRVQDRPISLDLLVNGTFRQRVETSTALHEIDGVRFEVPGVYQLELRSGGGGIRALSNSIRVSPTPDRILWADLGEASRATHGLHSPESFSEPLVQYDLRLPAESIGDSAASPLPGTDAVSGRIDLLPGSDGPRMVFQNVEGRDVTVALAEKPTDLRYATPNSLQLVQVVAGGSLHRWMGDRVAGQGFRVGFVGSNHSFQYPGHYPAVYTGVRINRGQNWFDAFHRGKTWVSVGSKIEVQTASEIPLAPVRELSISVTAPESIVSVALFKNGAQIAELIKGEPNSAMVALDLWSDSRPFSPLKTKPRNAREWIGYLATRDGSLGDAVVTPDGWQTRLDANLQRLDFFTRTHGIEKTLVVPVNSLTEDTIVEIGLAEVLEDAAWLPRDRLPASIRGRNILISAAELDETARAELEVNGYRDSLTLRRLPGGLVRQGDFRFQDSATPRMGDYYYYIVRLIDGSYAISSPIYLADRTTE